MSVYNACSYTMFIKNIETSFNPQEEHRNFSAYIIKKSLGLQERKSHILETETLERPNQLHIPLAYSVDNTIHLTKIL